MLTQNEKDWLAERNKTVFLSCRYCPGRDKQTKTSVDGCMAFCWNSKLLSPCEGTTNELRFLQAAAEFESRVAVRLATLFQYITMDASYDHEQEIPCNDCPIEHKCTLDCKESVLKYARLAVEEEMDNEID